MAKRKRDGLYRRKNEILHFRYQDLDGRWLEKSTGCHDRDEAKNFRDEFLAKFKAGELPTENAKDTVAASCTRWVEHHATVLTSPKARKNERSYLHTLIRSLGSRTLASITLADLKEYQTERSKQVRARPINCELAILISVLKEENCWHGPITKYKRLPEPESSVGRALTDSQRQLLERTAASRDAWQVAYWAHLLAINSGMRGVEIKKLQFRHINLEGRRLTIERAKTKKGNRLVALSPTALWALSQLYQRAQHLGACSPEHYLLPADLSRHTKNGDPLKGQTGFDVTLPMSSWDTAWRNLRPAAVDSIRQSAQRENRQPSLAERADIEALGTVGFHSMRHSFISRAAELGIPVSVIKDQVGHMSDEMTDHYIHIAEQAQRKAVESMDKNPRFVEDFVEVPPQAEPERNLLN